MNANNKAILLANMGAPDSEPEMRVFLKRMFNDKAIIFAPKIVRIILSSLISNLRYKSSWKKYKQIGGSPLLQSMQQIATDLQKLVGAQTLIEPVYSYSEPFIENKINELYAIGVKDITIISMYPQASFSTTGSVQASLDKVLKKFDDIQIRFEEDYFDHELFVQCWVRLIQQKIAQVNYQHPYLLFSSHAIPKSFVKRGDKYAEKMQVSAKLIATALNLPYSLAFQSKIGPTKWTSPYTIDELKALHSKGINEIVVVPLSFINENLETKYDLDTELIPFAINTLKISKICRVQIPESDETLVRMFYNFSQ